MASEEPGDSTSLKEIVGITYKIGKAFDILITKIRKRKLNRSFV